MPCLILTGHPCSGKTTLAHVIRDVAETHFHIPTRIVSESVSSTTSMDDEGAAVPIGDCFYATSAAEKSTRASLKSEYDRLVSNTRSTSSGRQQQQELVILDSMNYIKGFRYELYCISKAANERHGVVWVLNQIDLIHEWNKKANRYSEVLMNELIQRYEPPDDRNRWDSPLYRIDMRPSSSKNESSPNTSTSVTQASLEVLERSVYDMHKLSTALNQQQEVHHDLTAETTTKTTKTTTTEATTINKPQAGFKRAVFKRPNQPPPKAETADVSDQNNHSAETHQHETAAASTSTAETLTTEVVDSNTSLEDRVLDMLRAFLSDENKPLKSGTSTIRHEAAEANALHSVDSVTLQVCNAIAASSSKTSSNCSISLFGETTSLHFTRTFSLAELRRLRRQYIQWAATYPPEDTTEPGVARAFLAYIETQQ